MGVTDYEQRQRFEYGWVLAGLAWGLFLGILGATVPMLLVMLPSGESLRPDDTWTVPLLWLLLFAVTGAMNGGIAGTVVGVVVMLAVGRDPEQRAARRIPATVALLVTPLLLRWFW